MTRIAANTPCRVRLTLNGKERVGQADSRMLLSDFIRHELGATGTHLGCEHGVCGACTVRVDGVASRACLMLAVQAQNRRIDTVEGLCEGSGLGDLQAAFKRHHALQCGFCTGGILNSCAEFLSKTPGRANGRSRHALGPFMPVRRLYRHHRRRTRSRRSTPRRAAERRMFDLGRTLAAVGAAPRGGTDGTVRFTYRSGSTRLRQSPTASKPLAWRAAITCWW